MRGWRTRVLVVLLFVGVALGLASVARADPSPSLQLPGVDSSVQLPPPDPSVQLPPVDPSVQFPLSEPSIFPGPSVPSPNAISTPLPGSASLARNSGVADSCRPDPSAAIAAGGVWDGEGKCYLVPDGLIISEPSVVKNAIFFDPTSQPPVGESVKPIIRVKDAVGVRLTNLTLIGTNSAGTFHSSMVGEAGVDILSSTRVTITNVTTANTYGDGLTVGFQPHQDPNRDLIVNGMTILNAGRQGVTLAYLRNAALTNVTVVNSAEDAVDFESDIAGAGSGSVVVTNLTSDHGVRLIEALSGPVTFINPNVSGDISLAYSAAQSGQPVLFRGGSVLLKDVFNGTPPAGIWVSGPGNLEFTDVAIGRQPTVRAITGPAWLALNGARLTFDGGSVLPPLGSNDGSSTVVFTD